MFGVILYWFGKIEDNYRIEKHKGISRGKRMLKKNNEEFTRNHKIIVSLTSYPARIHIVQRTIKTILIQNRKADKIILWLSEEQFPNRERDLPSELQELCSYGLTIRWCDDLKPHKKYFYAMQEFPNDIIVTVDDDMYYSPDLLEILYQSFLKFPQAVSCIQAHRILRNKEGLIEKYDLWEKGCTYCRNEPCADLIAIGCGGVLYPPHCLPTETFDEDTINEICLYQDDLWLKAMELMSVF